MDGHALDASTPCLGRESELARLDDGLREALRGRGRICLLHGEAGIGKTRLAQELAARISSAKGRVLWGRCYEAEAAPAFWPWIEALRGYVEGGSPANLRATMGAGASRIAAILPELEDKLPNLGMKARADPAADRFRLFDAVRTFLGRASRDRPILLVLDDLHWADNASLLLLEFIAQHLPGMSVLVVGTYRQGEQSGPLGRALGELARGPLQLVALRGLSETNVGQLLTAVMGVLPSEDLVRRVHGHTEGNPFFATEIARLLEGPGTGYRIPDSVKGTLKRRMDRLSGLANQLLVAASVIGREFELEVLERTLGSSDRGKVLRAVEEALRALIIEPAPLGGERYQFRHALIRDALYEDLSPSRSARWHARVVTAFEEMPGGRATHRAPELAHHAARAGRLIGAERRVKYATIAGQHMLAAYAPEEALPHFERAWQAGQDLPLNADAATILVGLGCAQAATALRWNRQEAWATLRRALELEMDTGNVAEAVAIATHACITPEGADNVAATVQRVMGMVATGSREEGWLQARFGAASYFETGDYRRAQVAFERALAVAAAHGDVALELRTLAYATSVDHFETRWQKVLSNSRRVIDLARRTDDLHAETYARYRAAYALMLCESSDEARVEADANLACAERLRDHGHLADALWVQAALAQLAGDWAAARDHSERGLALSPDHLTLLHARMMLEYETGKSDAGAEWLRRLVDADRRAGPYPLAGVFAAAGMFQASRVAPISADPRRLGRMRAILARTFRVPNVEAIANIGRALLALQDRNASKCVAARRHLQPLGDVMFLPFLVNDRVRGLLAHAAGLIDRATADFENALLFCRRARYRPELAWTCYDYARMLAGRSGRTERRKANDLLVEAHGIACELGMGPLARLVATFQDRHQSRLIGKPLGLTDREIEILRLLVQGKTNKQMARHLDISANTIAVHVAHILRKTSSSNRTEAVAVANREQLAAAIAD
jgi:predicted ATPase/DNA-binding CsgD family transcriptional regulator